MEKLFILCIASPWLILALVLVCCLITSALPEMLLRLQRFLRRYKSHIALGIVAFALVSSAGAAEAPELKRRLANGVRVRMMNPYMQPKVGAILADLEGKGFKPVIDSRVYRTRKQQEKLKAKGVSWVSYSLHMATSKDGKPDALAADIVDYYKGWNMPDSYWLQLASSAQSHELTTGIYWGLSATNRERIRQLIQSKAWTVKYTRGKDAAHVEPPATTLTYGEAEAGKRPKPPKK